MRMTGAEAIIKSLEKEGVKYIFGYPGGAVIPIYDELLKSNQIEHILVRNEQAAAHAASGQSQSSNSVGVCLATSGPGATNLVTGIATAFMDSVPLIAITGQVPTHMIGTDSFQEVDITGITSPIVKHNYLVKDPKDIPQIIKDAFHIANTGRKGPVLIDIPRDIQIEEFTYKKPIKTNLDGYRPNYHPNINQIRRIIDQISKSERPLILIGGGIVFSHSYKEVKRLLEIFKAPVISTLMGISSIDGDHPLFYGMAGLHGSPAANYAVSNCDFLLSLGARFGDRATLVPEKFAPNATIAHVDIDPAEIGKNIKTDIPIVADLKLFLREFIEVLEESSYDRWLQDIDRVYTKYPLTYKQDEELKPQVVIEALSKYTNGDAYITTEVGQHQMFTAQFFKFKKQGGFITSGGLGTMGYGLPAAIGVSKSNPEDLVVNICGDGSLQMNLPEIATALEQDLPIKLLLFDNSSLNLVRQLQHFGAGGRHSGVDFTMNPNFNKLVGAYPNTETHTIKSIDEIEDIFDQALNNGKFTLINCKTKTSEIVYPVASSRDGLSSMHYLDDEEINIK